MPGEDKPRARALKPKGQKTTTKDRETAAKVAFALWEQAVREDAREQVRTDTGEKIAILQTKLLQKMHDVSQVVNRLSEKDGVRGPGKANANVPPPGLSCDAKETGICDCCESHDVPFTTLQAIDSGQMLCPECLAELKAAAQASVLGEKGARASGEK